MLFGDVSSGANAEPTQDQSPLVPRPPGKTQTIRLLPRLGNWSETGFSVVAAVEVKSSRFSNEGVWKVIGEVDDHLRRGTIARSRDVVAMPGG
jgi:hypothetical protein